MSVGYEDVEAEDFALDRIIPALDGANCDRMLKAKISEADDARTDLEETPTSSAPAWPWERDCAGMGINQVQASWFLLIHKSTSVVDHCRGSEPILQMRNYSFH